MKVFLFFFSKKEPLLEMRERERRPLHPARFISSRRRPNGPRLNACGRFPNAHAPWRHAHGLSRCRLWHDVRPPCDAISRRRRAIRPPCGAYQLTWNFPILLSRHYRVRVVLE